MAAAKAYNRAIRKIRHITSVVAWALYLTLNKGRAVKCSLHNSNAHFSFTLHLMLHVNRNTINHCNWYIRLTKRIKATAGIWKNQSFLVPSKIAVLLAPACTWSRHSLRHISWHCLFIKPWRLLREFYWHNNTAKAWENVYVIWG